MYIREMLLLLQSEHMYIREKNEAT